ncbi:MAG: lamin tail domain-containing protein, partial [Anaerolineales bacterium]|nr:lamin tail domain-containing protein [Anaerolineales bacterium]
PRPIINEILPRPGFDWNQDGRVNVFDEFIEIKNLTSIDITLNGWKLDTVSGGSFSLPNVTLKPGERIAFYSLETNLLLSDGGETVRLIDASGKIYDAYTYTIAKVEDRSICRLPDGNVFNGWYDDCIPTPNLSNTREGAVPSMPDEGFESPVCQLPDTLPADFLFAECHGYGANIWNAYYWDQLGMQGSWHLPQNTSKWEAIIE